MAVSINWATKVITIPQADLTSLGGSRYALDVDALRLELKNIEDSEEGITQLDTHRRNAPVTLAGVTYAQTFEIINGYTIEFEDGAYTVLPSGANHNIGDVQVVNNVSLVIGNSAGLITVSTTGAGWDEVLEGGYTAGELLRVLAAVAAGKTDITGTTVTFRDVNDTTDRVVASMTGSERTTVTLDVD